MFLKTNKGTCQPSPTFGNLNRIYSCLQLRAPSKKATNGFFLLVSLLKPPQIPAVLSRGSRLPSEARRSGARAARAEGQLQGLRRGLPQGARQVRALGEARAETGDHLLRQLGGSSDWRIGGGGGEGIPGLGGWGWSGGGGWGGGEGISGLGELLLFFPGVVKSLLGFERT